MTVPYNGSGSADLVNIIVGADTITQGLLTWTLLLLIYAITYFASAGEPTRESMAATAFVGFLAAVIMRYIGLLQDVHLGVAVVVMVGAMVMLFIRN